MHRPSYLDYVGVKRFDGDGNVVGERRFLGLYTTVAYREVPANIPVLRRKAQAVLERAGFPPGSHDHKALVEIIDTFPRDELFQMTADELYEIARGILELGERQRVRLFMRTDRYERFVSCLVFLPRDRFNTANRMRIGEILREALGAETVDWELRLTEWVLVRIHFTLRVRARRAARRSTPAELEARIVEATRSWDDDLQAVLHRGERRGGRARRSSAATARRSRPPTARTCSRARRSPTCSGSRRWRATTRSTSASTGRSRRRPATLRCKLYRRGERVSLSDVLPMFESLGLTVTDERPVPGHAARRPAGLDLRLRPAGAGDVDVDVDAIRERFHEGFVRVWRGDAELDGFNGLIIAAGLDWREVTMLRSVARYLRQAGIPFSDRYMERDAARARRRRARRSCALPRPLRPGRRPRAARRPAWREIEAAIDAVDSLDEDRILRGFLSRRAGDAAHQLLPAGPEAVRVVQARPDADPARAAAASRASRSSCTRRGSRACTCAAARSPAAACAGPIAARTSAPRSSG